MRSFGYNSRIFIQGISWTAGLRGLLRLMTVLRTAVLVRILSRAQLGVFGIAAMVLAFLEIVTETGINVFLLQEKDKIEEYIDTAWIISIVRGFLISVVILIITPFVSNFFNSPPSKNLLYLLAIVPLVRGFINPSIITFQKQLQFSREFFLRFSIFFVEAFFGVIICWWLKSPVGIVWGLMLSAVSEVIFSWCFILPRPSGRWEFSKLKNILNKGKWVTGFGFLDYIFTQGDNVVVGKLLGESSLGVYQNVYKISTLPVTEVVDVFYKTTFPIFSQMTNTGKSIKSAVLKTLFVTNSLTIIFGILIFVFAKNIIWILFGPSWLDTVAVLQILAFLGIARGLSYSLNSVFMSQHKQKYVTAIILTSTFGLLLTIVPAVRAWGIIGAGISATFGAMLALPVAGYLAYKLFKTL